MNKSTKTSVFRIANVAVVAVIAIAACGITAVARADTKTWTGAVNALWSTPGNWVGGVPAAGDRIAFGASAINKTNTNDLAAGTVFYDITFLGSSYVINGNSLGLTNGITSNTAPNTVNVNLKVMAPQTMGGAICCGPLNLNGTIDLGSNLLTFDYQVNAAGLISGTGGLAMGDVITLSANNTYTGPTTITQRGQIDGAQPSSTVTAGGYSNAVVSGIGTIGPVTLNSSSSIQPGQNFGYSIGRLTSGSVLFDTNSLFLPQISGTVPAVGYDQLKVTGTVTINAGVTLGTQLGYTPSLGHTYTIVDNDGADPVVGTFTGLPEGATINLSANEFKISYVGGTGNDIVLTVTAAAKTWTGAVNNLWSNPGNWLGGVPGPGDPIVFPSGAANLSNTDDLSDGPPFKSILFTGSNYVISGGDIGLTNGISSTAAPNTINSFISLAAPQTFGGAICCGPLNLGGGISLGANLLALDNQVNVTGIITGTGGVAMGDVITLSANNTYTGPTTISQRGQIDGLQPGSAVTAGGFSNAVVSGKGQIGAVTVNSSASIQPGQNFGYNIGRLTSGSVTFNTNSLFLPQLNGTVAAVGYDQLKVAGSVTINVGVVLGLQLGYSPNQGDTYVVVDNDGVDPVNGVFDSLPEGATINLGANTAKITYVGGTGNDIVVTVISAAKTWTGAANNLWSNPGNWQGGVVPVAGDPLVFPSGAANLTNFDDLTDGLVFKSILFSGSGYVISGSAFGLTNGITSTTASNTINNDINVMAPQTIGGALCCGPLNLNGVIDLGSNLLTFDYQVNASGKIIGTGGLNMGDVITLSANNTYTGPTTISQRGEIDGVQPASVVSTGGFGNAVVCGKGTTGPLTLNSSGSIQPGQNLGGSVGKLSSGSVAFNASSYLYLQLNGSLPGGTYDQLNVTGTVSINGSSNLYETLGFTPAQGQVFVIVNNDGTDPVSGTFNGLPQDGTFNLGPYPFKISYIGKTGNDITITSLSGDPFNHAPVAVADAYYALKNTLLSVPASGVLANDSDSDLNPITVVLSDLSSVQGGAVSVAANGGFTYNPPSNYTGTDSFSYIISDGLDATDIATVTITVLAPAGVGDDTAQLPLKFELLAPRPNPSRENVELMFGLPDPGMVQAEVFDASGRRVAQLADGESFTAGYHSLHWNGRDEAGNPVATGIYFVRVSAASHTALQKLVMLSSR
jgi:fibronectin-binding autotransporter adhesin